MESFNIVMSILNSLILIATAIYIARSPITAVKIGRRLDNEERSNNSKRDLFLTLYPYRGDPVHSIFVTSLNQIDIVFHDNPEVLQAWQTLYSSLNIEGQVDEKRIWELMRVELLSRMAVILGYPQLKQVDIMKTYTPIGHKLKEESEYDFRNAQFAYYKSGAAMNEKAFERMIKLDQLGDFLEEPKE